MPSRIFIKNCLTVLLATGGATGLRFLFSPALGSRVPFLFYVLAVAVSAEVAGAISGGVVTALSILLVGYSAPSSDHHMQTVLAIFGAVGIALSLFGGWRKRLKDELSSANERLALRHEVACMGSFEWYPEEDRFVASPEMKALCGIYPPDRMETFNEWKSYLHPEDRAHVIAGLAHAMRSNLAHSTDTYRIIRPDGETRWLYGRRKYRYDSAGKLLHVISINMDVTDLKRGKMAEEILGGLLQVCSACRRIHDGSAEEWYSMEGYLRRHSTAKFSHGMCPDCSRQWYAEAPDGEASELSRA